MARVVLSGSLVRLSGGIEHLDISAHNVRGLIAALDARFPGMAEQLESGIAVAIDGEIIPDAMLEPVPDDAEVHFVPALGGG